LAEIVLKLVTADTVWVLWLETCSWAAGRYEAYMFHCNFKDDWKPNLAKQKNISSHC